MNLMEKYQKKIDAAKDTVFCTWQETLVPVAECKKPCFEFSAGPVIHECDYFKAFWKRRLSELEAEGF
ncbi:MAG: hypothetical protein ABSA46_08595 [Thermodesulfovibrionales bacterium]|jgi:hypothetical protein